MSTNDPNIMARLNRARAGKPKKVYEGPKAMSDKKKAQTTADKKEQEEGGDPTLEQWFQDQRVLMTGRCQICGAPSQKWDDNSFRGSLHHLFEKNNNAFPSVKTHPHNVLEVCMYGNACHANLHNGTITWELLIDSAEWPMILEKVRKVVPFIAQSERRRIPEALRPFIKDLI